MLCYILHSQLAIGKLGIATMLNADLQQKALAGQKVKKVSKKIKKKTIEVM